MASDKASMTNPPKVTTNTTGGVFSRGSSVMRSFRLRSLRRRRAWRRPAPAPERRTRTAQVRRRCRGALRERRVGLLDADGHLFAVEPDIAVAQHRAGKETRLEQDLEAVADAQDRPAGAGELEDGGHDRREPRDGAGAQVIAVRES